MRIISALLFVLASSVTWPALAADCPADLMSPRIQAEAKKIIESAKGLPEHHATSFRRPAEEFPELMFRLVAERLRDNFAVTQQQILDLQKDPRVRDMARNSPQMRESLNRNASDYADRPDPRIVDKVLRDPPLAFTCFPEFRSFIQRAKETYESVHRKEENSAAEARSPLGQLRQTYLVFITIQRCGAKQDYTGPLLTESDLQRAKEATGRAKSRLSPRLDQGVTSDQVWDQALALPPMDVAISRYTCAQMLSALLSANPLPLRLERP